MFYTYAHIKPDGNIFYIGKGSGNRAWKKTRRNQYWKNIVAKYTEYKVQILAVWQTEKEALDHEIFLISCFHKLGHKLANITSGGEGTSGYKHTEERKQKLKELWSGQNNPNFGKILSKQTKEKISQTKILSNCRGIHCVNFKGFILATNVQTGESFKFEGVAELIAAGFQNSNVYNCINGKRKTHKGYTFKRL